MRDKSELNNQWTSFPHLRTAEQLQEYFDIRTDGHKEFFHHTSLKAIDKILETETIRISSSDRFNDKKDREQFGSTLKQKMNYALCFSTGKNENLSLWYLYSGVDGRGGRIGLTYKKLIKFINEGEFYLTEYDYDNHTSIGESIPLKHEENMRMKLQDMLYSRSSENGKPTDLKYNTMTNHGHVLNEELDKYKAKNVGFNKTIIWYHEKESRLLIELIGDAAKVIDEKKNYAVLWKLPKKQIKHLKIMCAPEIAEKSELDGYENIKKFMLDTSRLSLSENAGDIQMNVCAKCNYKEKFNSRDKINKTEENERRIKDDKAN